MSVASIRQAVFALVVAATAVQAMPSAQVCCGSPTNCPEHCGRVRYS